MADMCRVSPLYCHRLFFILETESVPLTKKDGRRVFLDFADHLPAVCKRLQDRALQEMIPFERELFDAQFKFVDQLTRISGELMNVPQTERKTYIRRRCSEVARLTNVAFIYLPTIPRLRITSIAANSGTPMQSAAKAPYLISFHCGQTQEIGYFIEAERRQKLGALTSNDENEEALGLPCDGATKQFSCIVKMGDDLRQDDLALQVIQLCRYIFQQLGSRLWLRPEHDVAPPTGKPAGLFVEHLLRTKIRPAAHATVSRSPMELPKVAGCLLSCLFRAPGASSQTHAVGVSDKGSPQWKPSPG
eukprot:Polyplicarium_translucidae@DN509_c0_g1_i2.p1